MRPQTTFVDSTVCDAGRTSDLCGPLCSSVVNPTKPESPWDLVFGEVGCRGGEGLPFFTTESTEEAQRAAAIRAGRRR
jgi:hypothetical protein